MDIFYSLLGLDQAYWAGVKFYCSQREEGSNGK